MLIEGLDLSACATRGGGTIEPADASALIEAWSQALTDQREELQAGPLPLEGAEPALYPAGFHCTLRSGGAWP